MLKLNSHHSLGRILFASDDDFLVEAKHWYERGVHFAGIIYVYQLNLSIGGCIDDLEMIAKAGSLLIC